MLTLKEKEKYIIQYLEEGKSFADIAKELHVSFRDIDKIKKKLTGENKLNKDISSKSNLSKALELYSQGKNLSKLQYP